MNTQGIHHISAFTGDAAANHHFYTHTLGLRLVKKSVNQDDPRYYHLFYGTGNGEPGTLLTFFEIPDLQANKPGVNSIYQIALLVPDEAALYFWHTRLQHFSVTVSPLYMVNGHAALSLIDPDGLTIRLLSASVGGNQTAPSNVSEVINEIPDEAAITGLGPSYLFVKAIEKSLQFFKASLGFSEIGRYKDEFVDKMITVLRDNGENALGAELHIAASNKDEPVQRLGIGGVHHLALQISAEQLPRLQRELREQQFRQAKIKDRYYFQSLYVREPNYSVIEFATNQPGFTVDEEAAALGTRLALPPRLESQRSEIEATLKKHSSL